MELSATNVLTLERWINASTLEKQEIIVDLVQRLYAEHRSLRPRHPWILLYVLPREQKIGNLFIPGSHHKVTLEGIVLSTWSDWVEEVGIKEKDGTTKTRVIVHRSEHAIGEHVVFPHWSGLPIPGMDESKFRIVKELGWSRNEEGGIFGVVEYDEANTSPQVKLRALLEEGLQLTVDTYSVASNPESEQLAIAGLLAAKIEEQFFLLDKSRTGVTLSAFGNKHI